MYFEPSSILRYHLLLQSREYIEMAENQRTVTVTIVEKTARRLILKRGRQSTDYFGYCEEIGCDAFEALETIPHALEPVVFLELPPGMLLPGTSRAAAALEVPADYSGEIPEGFEVIDLPPCLMMWFNGAPYEDESLFGVAHEELYRAIAGYRPALYGYAYAKDAAPVFHYFASAATGVRQMIPVKRL